MYKGKNVALDAKVFDRWKILSVFFYYNDDDTQIL